ncbi:hypothetical protein SAMN05443270_1299 [Lacrimispora sphenoides]|jgi:hypothetical protein|nr:hypothetical protein SAMN05443270_1299 [Lacrimispora sphenoides]
MVYFVLNGGVFFEIGLFIIKKALLFFKIRLFYG